MSLTLVSAEETLLRLEVIIAVLALAGGLKSAYNGTIYKYVIKRLRKAEEAHRRVEDVDRKMDEVIARQKIQTSAIIAVGIAANGDQEFDHEEYQREAGEEGASQFLEGD